MAILLALSLRLVPGVCHLYLPDEPRSMLLAVPKLFLIFIVTIPLLHFGQAGKPLEPEPVNTTTGICVLFVRSQGYSCQEFQVPTEDGYLLGVQRMRNKTAKPVNGPVFLYHGIMQGGDIWVLNGPGSSLAFLLADAGYDVWIGSTRSSIFSYGHVTYKRSDEEFWDWTWDDLVAHDLPSMLRFVHNETQQTILYVGYSQGTMTGFASFSHNQMAQLVKKVVMLSPIAYLNHVSSPVAATAAWLFLDKALLLAGVHEFNISSSGGKQLVNTVCKHLKLGNCYSHLLNLVTGPNCCLNRTKLSYYNRYELQSTSMKNVAHMAQLMRTGRFGMYDYGWFGNLFHYRDFFPPSYDMSSIPMSLPILLAHGGRDDLVDAQDIRHLLEDLQGKTQILFMPNYAHGDFVLGSSAKTDVYTKLLLFFEEGF
eukprot:c21042_g1_i5 orf=542-1813(+)